MKDSAEFRGIFLQKLKDSAEFRGIFLLKILKKQIQKNWKIPRNSAESFFQKFWRNKFKKIETFRGIPRNFSSKIERFRGIPRNVSSENWKIPRNSAENVGIRWKNSTFSAEFRGIFQFLGERFRGIPRNCGVPCSGTSI